MNFDLDIENYKEQELKEIFGLSTPYQASSVRASELRLRENIMNDLSVNKETKTLTLEFIKKATLLLNAAIKSDTVAAGETFIIQHPATPYTNSLPSEFYQGVINPLQRRTLRQTLNIDTRFRDNLHSTESTNFHFDLPTNFNKVMTMQVTAFEFPPTYYAVHKGTNYFAYEISGVLKIVIIPDGNYTADTLTTILSSTEPDLEFMWDQLPDRSGTGKMIVTATTDLILRFDTDINGHKDQSPLPLKLGWMLGFRYSEYNSKQSYTSEGIVDLSGPKYLYLAIDDYNNNVNNGFYSAFNASVLNNNIIARISLKPGTSNFLGIADTTCSNIVAYPRQYFGPVDIKKLHVQLLDEYGRQIRLNYMDYSFCLTMQVVYDI